MAPIQMQMKYRAIYQHRANLPFKLYSSVPAFYFVSFLVFRFLRDFAYSSFSRIQNYPFLSRARNRFLESKEDLKRKNRERFSSLKFSCMFFSRGGKEMKDCIPRSHSWSKGAAIYAPEFLATRIRPRFIALSFQNSPEQGKSSRQKAPWILLLFLYFFIARLVFVDFGSSFHSPSLLSIFHDARFFLVLCRVVPPLFDNNTRCRILNRVSRYEREKAKLSKKRASKSKYINGNSARKLMTKLSLIGSKSDFDNRLYRRRRENIFLDGSVFTKFTRFGEPSQNSPSGSNLISIQTILRDIHDKNFYIRLAERIVERILERRKPSEFTSRSLFFFVPFATRK